METSQIMELFNLSSLTMLVRRPDVEVYEGRLNDQKVILKIHSSESHFIQETDSLKHLNEKNAPVPQILYYKKVDDCYCFLQEWWDGTTLDQSFNSLTRNEQLIFLKQIGKLLTEIQSILSENELNQSLFWRTKMDSINNIKEFSWKNYYQSQFYKWANRVKIRSLDRKLGLERQLKKLEETLFKISEPEKITILHNDFCLRNIMITPDQQQVIGLIDFEHASIGDPTFDLVKLIWTDIRDTDNELINTYLSSYEKEKGQPIDQQRLNLYKAVSGLGAIAWVDKQPTVQPQNEEFRKKGLSTLLSVSF